MLGDFQAHKVQLYNDCTHGHSCTKQTPGQCGFKALKATGSLSYGLCKPPVVYTPGQLKAFRHVGSKGFVDCLLKDHVKKLGINKLPKRGKKRRVKKHREKDFNKGVHFDLLRSLPKADIVYCQQTQGLKLDSVNVLDNLSKETDQYLKCGLLNCRSIINKDLIVHDYMVENSMDILLATETWINNDDHMAKLQCSELNTHEYRVNCSNRAKRGGGVGIVYNKNIKVRKIQEDVFQTFQSAIWEVTKFNTTYNIICVYRPPSSSTGQSVSKFLDAFSGYMSEPISRNKNTVIGGDFNIHMNDTQDHDVSMFSDMMDSFGFKQHVAFDTHTHGHTIDLVFTEVTDDGERSACVECQPGQFLSDHRLVEFSLALRNVHSSTSRDRIMFRKLRSIDLPAFKADVEEAFLNWDDTASDLNECLASFNSILDDILDLHAPLISAKLSIRKKKNTWYTPELRQQKRLMRRWENIWKKHKTNSTWTAYKLQKDIYSKQLKEEKTKCYSGLIIESGKDMSKLYKILNKWTGRELHNPLPDDLGSDKDMAEKFADFFVNKITAIRDSLDDMNLYSPSRRDISVKLTTLHPVTCEEVHKTIMRMPTKSCEKDHLPTQLLKECLNVLIGPITDLVNISLKHGVFATEWKEAIIRPLLKKAGMQLTCKSYRPVSNLPFLSKLVEKLVLQQTNHHCDTNAPLPDYQSAYRPGFSCETALVNIVDDILWAFEKQEITQLCLMDLSAAFDTVHHQILLEVLERQFGIEGTALQWFKSYLENRRCTVNIRSEFSTQRILDFSVPQGSLGGPVMYSQYASTLQYEVPSDFKLHGYADDHCLKKTHKPTFSQAVKVSNEISSAMVTINKWMDENRLKLNNDKTEYIMFGSCHQLCKCIIREVEINNAIIKRSQSVKYLGVMLDENLTMTQQISSKCRAAMYGLRLIRSIRSYLTDDACHTAVLGLVISHLDYANALYVNLPATHINRMQCIQNMAAKLVTGMKKYDSASAALRQLHWLPIRKRIEHKVLCLVYKSVVDQSAPMYLREKFQQFSQGRNLRSNQMVHRLKVPTTSRKTFADRSISVAGPRLWNNLPNHLKALDTYDKFKKALKTHLFSQ